jgi:FAD/FMN-containing dehydrogenase
MGIEAGDVSWLGAESTGADTSFATMKKVKSLFDPNGLLNPLRLYGRI